MNDKGVFIKWYEYQDKSTSLSEKFMYKEIESLSMLELGCIAKNEHFASIMGIEESAVSRLVNSLKKKGFITVKIKNGSRNHARKITLNKLLTDPKQFVNSPLTNCYETKGNKSINKSISKNIHKKINLDSLPKSISIEFMKEFIDYKIKKSKVFEQAQYDRAVSTIQNLAKKLNKSCDWVIAETIDAGWNGLGKEQWYLNRIGEPAQSDIDSTIAEIYQAVCDGQWSRVWRTRLAYTIYKKLPSSTWEHMTERSMPYKIKELYKTIDLSKLDHLPKVSK